MGISSVNFGISGGTEQDLSLLLDVGTDSSLQEPLCIGDLNLEAAFRRVQMTIGKQTIIRQSHLGWTQGREEYLSGSPTHLLLEVSWAYTAPIGGEFFFPPFQHSQLLTKMASRVLIGFLNITGSHMLKHDVCSLTCLGA